MLLRVSHSQLKLFKTCKRQYFYKYVQGLKEEDAETKYVDNGSAMHEVLEEYYKGNKDWQSLVTQKWESFKLDGRMDFNTFKLGVLNGVQQTACPAPTDFEMKFFVMVGPYAFVGYMDMVDTVHDIIVDWKSGKYTKQKETDYRDQLRCYAYLYWRKYNRLPQKCVIFFNMENKAVEMTFRMDEILDYEQYITTTCDEIVKFKATMKEASLWQQNFSACHFCGYKKYCFSSTEAYNYRIVLKNNFCFLEGDVTPMLLEGLDRSMKYDLKGKYFIQQSAVARSGGKRPANYDDIGTVHLFNKNHRMFALGHLNKVKQLVKDFCVYQKALCNIEIVDLREKDVLQKQLGIMPEKLHTEKELRDYQIEAIEAFIHAGGIGYIEIATGGGKSIVTAELIRMLDTTTLWIIDRKELLHQTKDWFEEYLGVPIGVIGDGECDIKDVTVATIQTLAKNIEKFRPYLHSVNFAIIDEAHHAAAETYQAIAKELRNTRYRLGTTATVKRDDGNEPILMSLFGDIVYHIGAQELKEKGHLVQSKVIFIELPYQYADGEYHEVYEDIIVNDETRNFIITDLARKHWAEEKKVLILTNRIEHGERLWQDLKLAGHETDSYFIHGSTPDEIRREKFAAFKGDDLKILIGTISIFSEGIDIPDLDIIINAAANKGEVKTIQTIGRVLRKKGGKAEGIYYDFIDTAPFLKQAAKARMKILREEGHEIDIDSSALES